MARPLWLVRPRTDGGSDYVAFVPGGARVEMREGSHLPPQMPLLKRRRWMPCEEAEQQRRRLQLEAGYRHSEPLFCSQPCPQLSTPLRSLRLNRVARRAATDEPGS